MIFSNLAAKLSSERTAWNPEEQRMSLRLWEYWNTLRGRRRIPSRAEFTVETVADLGQYGVTLELANQESGPVFRFVGKALIQECGQDLTGRSLADVPADSVLAWVVKNYANVVEQQAPIGFEDESVDGNASTKLRGILLPFSEDGEQVDFIVGAVTFKNMLSETIFKAPSDDPAGDGATVVAEVCALDPISIEPPRQVAPMQPEASSDLQHAERRASDWVDVCLPGSIAIGGQVVDCELVNLSLTGAKLKVAEDFVGGSSALLRIEELGEFPGEVIWRYNDKVGFAFSREHEGIAERARRIAGGDRPQSAPSVAQTPERRSGR